MMVTSYYKLAEVAASKFFDAKIKHHLGYQGFDLLCKEGQKIDVKKGKDKVNRRKINERSGLHITNLPKKLKIYRSFELVDRLQEFKEICDSITVINIDSTVINFPDI